MVLFQILVWAIYGLIVGMIARSIYGGGPASMWRLIGVGVAGSYVGGLFNTAFFGARMFAPSGIIMSVVGAIICCALYVKYLGEKT